jgi:hypothetical protein
MDFDRNEIQNYEIVLRTDSTADRRRYNVPTGEGQQEVAGFMPGDTSGPKRDIHVQIRAQSGPHTDLWRINDQHQAYDPLHFVLFYP